MESTIIDAALSQGVWAVLAVFLLLYVIKENEKCDQRQAERETQYQNLLMELADKLAVIGKIEESILEIKELLGITEKNNLS